MTYEEIAEMIAGIGLPYAYYQFPEDDNNPVEPPFICFYYPSENGFHADDKQYAKRVSLFVELYTNNKDFASEAMVETALTEAGLAWSRYESYIDSEKLYLNTYESEVFIDG